MQSGHFWLLDMSSVDLFLTVWIYSQIEPRPDFSYVKIESCPTKSAGQR
jgi:hypothetical protein